MFVDYGDLSGNSAEAVSKWEESSAQTNAVTQPMEQNKADGTHWLDPWGNIQRVGSQESLLGRLVQSLRPTLPSRNNWILYGPLQLKTIMKHMVKPDPCQAVLPDRSN